MEALLVMVLVTWVFVEYKSAGEVKEEELLLLLLLPLLFPLLLCCRFQINLQGSELITKEPLNS